MWCACFKSRNLSEKKQMKNKTKTFPLMRSHGGPACAVDPPVDFAECFTLKLECFPPCLFCRETLWCKRGKRATPLLMRTTLHTTFYTVSGVARGPDRLVPETILFSCLFKLTSSLIPSNESGADHRFKTLKWSPKRINVNPVSRTHSNRFPPRWFPRGVLHSLLITAVTRLWHRRPRGHLCASPPFLASLTTRHSLFFSSLSAFPPSSSRSSQLWVSCWYSAPP